MRQSKRDREAWTALVEGRKEKKPSKYNNEKTGGFDSGKEADYAIRFDALARAGKVTNLQYQVPIMLVAGKGKTRPITYVADFVFQDLDGITHVVDAKGFKTQVYRIKKKIAKLLLDIEIEEV